MSDANGGPEEGILDFVAQALGKGCFDAVLVPAKLPGSDSFGHVLIEDQSLLKDARPLCPVMPVQGARIISTLTRHGKGKKRIAALLRPCEVRAAIELSKLGGVIDLDNVFLISVDCPGVLPLSDWVADPDEAEEVFSGVLRGEFTERTRPICQMCDYFSTSGGEDVHIGTLGGKADGIVPIPRSAKGRSILDCLGTTSEEGIADWQSMADRLSGIRQEKRKQAHEEMEGRSTGPHTLLGAFDDCIDCHNCMRVCPMCYCRQCFFDSDNMKFSFDDHVRRAEITGQLRLPPDMQLFHIGRMLHMSLSCVSCGACEDACPVSIPVAQVFSFVAKKNQEAFDYVPGRSTDEPPPLRVYKEEEFEEVEQSHAEAAVKQEATGA